MQNPKYRILQVVAVMNRGGIETMLMNHYRKLDTSKVQFDFLVHYTRKGVYDDEIRERGGRIFYAPKIRPWTYPQYFRWLKRFFDEHANEFIAVHSHIQENSGFPLYFAKKSGISHRLSTSHMAPFGFDYKYPFKKFAQPFLKSSVTDRLACGMGAGKSLYGNAPFRIMPNAIDVSKFIFNPEVRAKQRKILGINDNRPVLGHVGRFSYVKNHERLIEIFGAYLKLRPEAELLLVGSGERMEIIRKLVEEKGLTDKIRFLGDRNDINLLLQAMDVFVMPSHFEGLPVSVIEAQAAGLPCILADKIDTTTDVSGNVRFVSLSETNDSWAKIIDNSRSIERKDMMEKLVAAGYEVNANLRELLKLYGIEDY